MFKYVKIFIFLLVFIPVSALAWSDCPFGQVNDEYPGQCRLYVDVNQDGICDHSQSASGSTFVNSSNSKTAKNKIYPILFLIILTVVLGATARSLRQPRKKLKS